MSEPANDSLFHIRSVAPHADMPLEPLLEELSGWGRRADVHRCLG
jgi:hypothetical protein